MFEDLSNGKIGGFDLVDAVVFDTETTGFVAGDDEILSIGICDIHGNPEFSSYVRPVRHNTWPDAERVNGISPDMVANAPTVADIAEEVSRRLDNRLVIGYNVGFDLGFLLKEGILQTKPEAVFDVMLEFAKAHGARPAKEGGHQWSKLVDCAAFYGLDFDAHDSLEDAVATAHCARKLLDDADWREYEGLAMPSSLRIFGH